MDTRRGHDRKADRKGAYTANRFIRGSLQAWLTGKSGQIWSVLWGMVWGVREKGIYTDTTKTKRSQRTIKFPLEIMELLRDFKEEQDGEVLKLGSKWVETDRLFVKWNGEPFTHNPNTFVARDVFGFVVYYWLLFLTSCQRFVFVCSACLWKVISAVRTADIFCWILYKSGCNRGVVEARFTRFHRILKNCKRQK